MGLKISPALCCYVNVHKTIKIIAVFLSCVSPQITIKRAPERQVQVILRAITTHEDAVQ